jgi:hypothetical protein
LRHKEKPGISGPYSPLDRKSEKRQSLSFLATPSLSFGCEDTIFKKLFQLACNPVEKAKQ